MDNDVLFPGSTIGIIGESPNGYMLSHAAHNLGFKVIAYGVNEESPTLAAADVKIVGKMSDKDKLQSFAERCDIVTYESEQVDANIISFLKKFTKIPQGNDTLEIAQDRLLERTFLEQNNINIAPYATIVNLDDVYQAVTSIGYPCILKSIQKGFKREQVIRKQTDIAKCESIIDMGTYILESMIPYEKELSVVVTRDAQGEATYFPLVENVYRKGQLHETIVPATVDSEIANEVKRLAEIIVTNIKYTGVLQIAFFLTETGALYVKKINPTVDSVGYVFNTATNVSMFEQHLRALAHMPLAQPELIQPTVMVVVKKQDVDELRAQWLLKDNWHYYFYRYPASMKTGLPEGHILVLAQTAVAAKEQIEATGIWDDTVKEQGLADDLADNQF
ncbi:ATP-grasp domain-containing protein [Ligilactobacillus sp. WILCCON 0076]|uniref:ATP-grasp domain-containing protein n=1 Tax=Ligilactobacillus ubinensis TaxID=2876789 RepID=A0A9X2JKB9_9LACO|nr:ATP-grasp domain-containing protein [Ligilactobacillus ubinensis]MCP0886093.1 ATP-grasp domain-containing protein [Ligilactobacillus ubinensis]